VNSNFCPYLHALSIKAKVSYYENSVSLAHNQRNLPLTFVSSRA
jgi:hypothetical protein